MESVPKEKRNQVRRKFWLTVIGSSIVIGLLFKFIHSLVIVPSSLPIFETILQSGFIIGAVIGFVINQVSKEPENENN